MPAHTTWTVHKPEKTWSEAELLCEMSGGYLANLNTSHKNDVFEELLSKEPWASAMSVLYLWQFLIVSKRHRGTAGDEKGGVWPYSTESNSTPDTGCSLAQQRQLFHF